jgi:F-type H+-transporting ATPase subunit delta
MTNRTAAYRYARALLDVAVAERADLDRIERDLQAFAGLLAAHATLERVLVNPAVPVPRKRAAVAELVARLAVAPQVGKLLVLLAERDRLALLPDLAAAYSERLLDHRRVVRAEVVTASPLASDRAAAIERGLAQVTGLTVTLSTRVDAALIGGVGARVGSTVYDGSIATQLAKMKQKLTEGV